MVLKVYQSGVLVGKKLHFNEPDPICFVILRDRLLESDLDFACVTVAS
jgi:hypothetical protein